MYISKAPHEFHIQSYILSFQCTFQLIPYLVMDILGHLHGFPGLLVACIFSASLRLAVCEFILYPLSFSIYFDKEYLMGDT